MKPLDMVHQTWKDKGFMSLLQTNDMKNLDKQGRDKILW